MALRTVRFCVTARTARSLRRRPESAAAAAPARREPAARSGAPWPPASGGPPRGRGRAGQGGGRPMGAEAAGGAGAGLRAGFWAGPSARQPFLQLPGSRSCCRLVRPWVGAGAGPPPLGKFPAAQRVLQVAPPPARPPSPRRRAAVSAAPRTAGARGRDWDCGPGERGCGSERPGAASALRFACSVQGPGRVPLERPLHPPHLAVWGDFSSSVTEMRA